jgi:thioredoxin 1
VAKSPLPVLVDFHATWCGPCKILAPVVDEIAGDMKGKLKVLKCDVDEAQDTRASLGILSVPTLVLFQGGKEVRRRVGAGPKASIVKDLWAKPRLLPPPRRDPCRAVRAGSTPVKSRKITNVSDNRFLFRH